MTDQQNAGVVPAGAVATRDIPIGTAITAADFGAGAEAPGPQEIHVGSGGDPLIIGIPIFVVGSLVLGLNLILNQLNPTPLATIVPAILLATAFFQFITAIWALLLGQGIVVSIFGLFSGFWASLAIFLLGLTHNWFGTVVLPGRSATGIITPAAAAALTGANISNAEFIYFIAWDVIFLFLTIVMLRGLPAIYPAILVLVLIAVTLVIFGVEYPGSAITLFQAAGGAIIAFCALGLVVFLHIGSVALGGPAKPNLGPVLIK